MDRIMKGGAGSEPKTAWARQRGVSFTVVSIAEINQGVVRTKRTERQLYVWSLNDYL